MPDRGAALRAITEAAVMQARVLVVDDEPSNVRLLERIFSGVGMAQVRSTTDSRDVPELVREFDPDVVLLDLHMPHRDGIAVLHDVNGVLAEDDFVPVVVLTADASPQTRERALANGATDYLTKPFDRAEVLLRVRNLVHRRLLHVQMRDHNRRMIEVLQVRERAEQEVREQAARGRRLIQQVLDAGGPHMVFQPIFDMRTGDLSGVEALARFDAYDARPPDAWFNEAAEHGLGVELELLAVRNALTAFDYLAPPSYVAVNLSAATILGADLAFIAGERAPRLVVEVTEHQAIDDYQAMSRALSRLRSSGARVAVDDAGSGYASLQHVLQLAPDLIKLDRALTTDLESDPARRALAAALVTFARDTGAHIVAEGIETAGALMVLQILGVDAAQGYFLARPAEALALTTYAAGINLVQ